MKLSRTGLLRHCLTTAALACAAACSTASSPSEPVATTSSTLAITGLFSTGVDATGTPLAAGSVDPHYVLSSSDPQFPGPNAIAVSPDLPVWTGNTATSSWISIQTDRDGATNAAYTYTLTFTLASVNPASATLAGSWAADDSVTLMLNGQQVAQRAAEAYGSATAFTVPAGSPFQTGTNTLAFVTLNSGGGPTGLQVVTLTGNVNGCDLDSQCTVVQFCDTQTSVCTAKLANGTAIPTLSGHSPALNGTCTVAVGNAVCASAVCDTKDNECGYANGDGTCTNSNAGTVCRSGACSVSGVCEPVGGCEVDADCPASDWCDISTATCTPKLANGTLIPTDPGHTNPMLNGTCTPAAGALVCTSAVCDTKDNECGYANGDGTCTSGTAGTVCRSGACSVSGVCEPSGGCASDADCTGGDWCEESTATCMPKLPNGSAIPVDAPHTNPSLNGECVPAAAALVCASGVCDTKDNKCGYANGDGPCTTGTGSTVCRSTACSVDGTCESLGGCNVNGDCPGSSCDTTTHACVATAADAGLDAGGDGSAGGDSGGGSADSGSTADASVPPADGGATAPDGSDGGAGSGPGETADGGPAGYLDGGGCAVGAAGHEVWPAGGVLAGLALLLGSRRRARGSRRRPPAPSTRSRGSGTSSDPWPLASSSSSSTSARSTRSSSPGGSASSASTARSTPARCPSTSSG